MGDPSGLQTIVDEGLHWTQELLLRAGPGGVLLGGGAAAAGAGGVLTIGVGAAAIVATGWSFVDLATYEPGIEPSWWHPTTKIGHKLAEDIISPGTLELSKPAPNITHRRTKTKNKCRGRCRRDHPYWPICTRTDMPEFAAMGHPQDRNPYRKPQDIVRRDLWQPVPYPLIDRKSIATYTGQGCLDVMRKPLDPHPTQLVYKNVKVQFTEIPPHKRKPGEHGRRSYSVVCCTCCTPPPDDNESTQCKNWHDSGIGGKRQNMLD